MLSLFRFTLDPGAILLARMTFFFFTSSVIRLAFKLSTYNGGRVTSQSHAS